MISNIFRSLHLQWRLNAAVLLCMTLASAFLAITSGYARLVATDELQQSLEETSAAGRTLLITGNRYSFSDELSQRLGKILDQALKDQLVIRHAASEPEQPTVIAVAGHSVLVRTLDLYSFNLLADNVRVIEGRLPTQVRLNEATDSWRPPPIEAVIGLSTAKLSGYAIGDRVSGDKGYHRLDIVGIVEPLDRGDDLWGQDLSAFEILTGKDQADSEGIALPLIIASTSMQSNYPERPVFLHQVSWRVTMNRHLIDVDDVETLRSDLANLQTQSATIRARTETDLVGILADFQVRVSRLRTMITLLTAQALIFVFYALATVASSQVVRSQVELATLSGRGASVWQILLAYTAEKLILAMVAALLLGPGLAQGVLTLWGTGSGEFSPIGLAGEAWLLSGLAAVLGWFALILPAYSTVRKRSADEQSWRHRPPRQSLVQRRYLDLFLLVIGGLLTWQLHQTGSFLMQGVRETRLADPLLLTGPSLMLIAITMVFLRLLPILFHLAGQLVRPLRGVVLSLSLCRLARDPLLPGRQVLLVSLTAGLVLFSGTLANTLATGHERLQVLQVDALAGGLTNALRLNAIALTLFSLTVFSLAHLSSALDRQQEYKILRVIGLSIRQSVALLVIEGCLVLLLGLAAGTAVGLGLSQIMIPFFLELFAEPSSRAILPRVAVDWPSIVRAYLLLAAIYGSTLASLSGVLIHTRVHWTQGKEDE